MWLYSVDYQAYKNTRNQVVLYFLEKYPRGGNWGRFLTQFAQLHHLINGAFANIKHPGGGYNIVVVLF